MTDLIREEVKADVACALDYLAKWNPDWELGYSGNGKISGINVIPVDPGNAINVVCIRRHKTLVIEFGIPCHPVPLELIKVYVKTTGQGKEIVKVEVDG